MMIMLYIDLLYDDNDIEENKDSCLPELYPFRVKADLKLCESEVVYHIPQEM